MLPQSLLACSRARLLLANGEHHSQFRFFPHIHPLLRLPASHPHMSTCRLPGIPQSWILFCLQITNLIPSAKFPVSLQVPCSLKIKTWLSLGEWLWEILPCHSPDEKRLLPLGKGMEHRRQQHASPASFFLIIAQTLTECPLCAC